MAGYAPGGHLHRALAVEPVVIGSHCEIIILCDFAAAVLAVFRRGRLARLVRAVGLAAVRPPARRFILVRHPVARDEPRARLRRGGLRQAARYAAHSSVVLEARRRRHVERPLLTTLRALLDCTVIERGGLLGAQGGDGAVYPCARPRLKRRRTQRLQGADGVTHRSTTPRNTGSQPVGQDVSESA